MSFGARHHRPKTVPVMMLLVMRMWTKQLWSSCSHNQLQWNFCNIQGKLRNNVQTTVVPYIHTYKHIWTHKCTWMYWITALIEKDVKSVITNSPMAFRTRSSIKWSECGSSYHPIVPRLRMGKIMMLIWFMRMMIMI